MSAGPGLFAVRLYDEGKPRDTGPVLPPAFDGSREHGFGLYIIAQNFDAIEHTRDEHGRNCIAMFKKLHQGPGQS